MCTIRRAEERRHLIERDSKGQRTLFVGESGIRSGVYTEYVELDDNGVYHDAPTSAVSVLSRCG
jgi:hypothetical protein